MDTRTEESAEEEQPNRRRSHTAEAPPGRIRGNIRPIWSSGREGGRIYRRSSSWTSSGWWRRAKSRGRRGGTCSDAPPCAVSGGTSQRKSSSPPEQCGRITFPISPQAAQATKFFGVSSNSVLHEKGQSKIYGSTFRLYLGLSPSLRVQNDKLLLASRKIRRATITEISLTADDFSQTSNTYIGNVRFPRNQVHCLRQPASFRCCSFFPSPFIKPKEYQAQCKQVSPRVPAGNFSTA